MNAEIFEYYKAANNPLLYRTAVRALLVNVEAQSGYVTVKLRAFYKASYLVENNDSNWWEVAL